MASVNHRGALIVVSSLLSFIKMSLNASRVKKFLMKVLRGNKKSENQFKDDVRWGGFLDEDKREDCEEHQLVVCHSEDPSGRDHYVTNIIVEDTNIHVTRASVYLNDDDGSSTNFSIPKVNSKCKLLDMDASAINFSESDCSLDDVAVTPTSAETPMESAFASANTEPGPLDPFERSSVLSAFIEGVETRLHRCSREDLTGDEQKRFESSNSLDIEKELNDLMGTLITDTEEGKSDFLKKEISSECLCDYWNIPESEEPSQNATDGSRTNLAFERTESDTTEIVFDPRRENSPHPTYTDYWTNQRIKSKSFAERYKIEKLLRRGKQRMSMIELRSKANKKSGDVDEPESSPCISEPKQAYFVGLAYDRSSLIEPRVSSAVSLPRRPRSAMGNDCRSPYSSECSLIGKPAEDFDSRSSIQTADARTPLSTPRASANLNDCIDWSWLEEAMNSLNSECHEHFNGNSSQRVDAECQTQPDQSWQVVDESMRGRSPSPRVSDSAPSVNSECRVVESGICNEDMPCKAFIEGSGREGVSSWLRQSMRRVRHFNLEDPSRIRSAPPDSLRVQRGSVPSESGTDNSVTNNRLSTGNEVQQRLRNDERTQRRRLHARPASAPARRSNSETTLIQPQQTQQQSQDSEPVGSSHTSEAQDNLGYESDSTDRHPSSRGRRHRDEEAEDSEGRSPIGPWPHGLSSVFAGLGCTLGLFNISRFAVLSVHFGSNFILQFLILSLVLGVPLLAFHAALGQTLGAGPVDMWKISPLFQGIGIALLLAQALIGMYSIVGVSWIFVYFRDSFITKQDSFRWAEPFRHYREDNIFATSVLNISGRLEETVPDYLNVVVLQRHGLTSPENAFGHLKFQLTFNLAVVWMIVFVSLSKGLRSYGKVVYVFSVIPVLGVLIICSKLLGLTPLHRGLFPQTEWSEFFLNAKSWISAATEVMLTWNLLGAASMQVTSHNRSTKKLWRDVATITVLTLLVLILAAFLGNMCHQLISMKGYSYFPSSFERISTYSFLRPGGAPLPPSYAMPIRHMPHSSLVAGDRVSKPGAVHESGYQVIRLATELMPATLAILEGNFLSPFWAVLFYFTLILFGIAQQLAIWHCVITGIMAINAPILKSWETTITFFTCAAGFVLGLPMTTELGIFVVYFLDYCLGGGWWIILLTLMEICAILMIRGRPYSGENISIALFGKSTNCFSMWAVPLLTFTWNVIMPVALLVMSITIFKSGGYRDLWMWKCGKGDYWPLWTREVGVFVQIIPLLCIPVVGLVQCYRYLSKGPADIFDRLANLYRPAARISGIADEESTTTTFNTPTAGSGANSTTELPQAEDPPPKYTPPPSYSTATGTRIAKLLRQSFRRSVRRLQTVLGPELIQPPRPPPPDYASVLVEMNHGRHEERETNSPAGTHNYTAADVAQILRCSFRRNNVNSQPQDRPIHSSNINNNNNNINNTSPNLVISPRESQ